MNGSGQWRFGLFGLALLCSGYSQAQTFSRIYENPGPDPDRTVATSVRSAPGGGFVVVGWQETSPVSSWVAAIDDYGDVVWQMGYSGAVSLLLTGVEPTADGGALLSGRFDGGLIAIKVDSAGAIEWQTAFGDGSLIGVGMTDTTTAANDGYFLAGEWSQSPDDRRAWLAKLDADGQLEWQRFYHQSTRLPLQTIVLTSNGGLMAAGNITCDTDNRCGLLAVLNASGSVSWSRSYDRPGAFSNQILAGIPTADGGYAATGIASLSFAAYVFKVDAAGGVVWSRGIFSAAPGAPEIVETSDEGFVLALGFGNVFTNPVDVIKLDTSGNEAWTTQFGTCGARPVNGMDLTDDDGVIIAGESSSRIGETTREAWLLRLSASGALEGDCPFVLDLPPSISEITITSEPVDVTASAASQPVIETSFEETAMDLQVSQACGSTAIQVLPAEISPTGSLEPLRFLDPVTLTWEDDPENLAERFHLYRSNGRPDFMHECLQPNLVPNQATDPEEPSAGESFSYLVSGVNDMGEGPLGQSRNSLGFGRSCLLDRQQEPVCP